MSSHVRHTSIATKLLCASFGLLLLAIGAWIAIGFTTDVLYGYWRTREEVKVPARLKSLEFREYRSKTGTHTYPNVEYEYEVLGQVYKGAQVSLFEISDALKERLKSVRNKRQNLEVIIDPRHPEFSVIDRDFKVGPVLVGALSSILCLALGGYLLKRVWKSRAS